MPLFFGRLDYEPGSVYAPDADTEPAGAEEADQVHIGRRHVHDAAGRPLVVGWPALHTGQ